MSFQSLRDFMKKLEEEGQLVKISKEIYPEPDIRNYLRAAVDMGHNGPAVIFDNIKGYKGYKVIGNVHGSWGNHALSLGMDKNASIREQFFEVNKLWGKINEGDVNPEWVDNAPCQEVIVEEDINLYELLPLFRINKYDGGFYFSKGSVVSQDLDEPDNLDCENVGLYRIMIQGPDTVSMQALPYHDLAGHHLKKAEERDESLPVAVCLGVPPVVASMSATALDYDESEYKMASIIMGEPLELTKCIGNNLDIPANSEYILEGEIIPRKRYCEGPFGEMPGTYSGARGQIRMKINRVTHRKNPIFENLYVGKPWTEVDTLCGLWTSVPVYRQLKRSMPEVTCVNALYQHGFTVIVSTDLRFGGFGKSVAFNIASTPHGISYCKNIILVDANIDPFNLTEVMWALSTRVRPAKDVSVIKNTPGMHLDPCSEPEGMGEKLIIDATTPKAPDSMREVTIVSKPVGSEEARKELEKLQKEFQ